MASPFIEALTEFINTEQDTQNRQLLEIWQQPVGKRVAAGEAVDSVEVLEILPHRATLRARFNNSKFRPNDNLRLSFDAPLSGFAVTCILEDEQNEILRISPGYRSSFFNLVRGGGYTLDRDQIDVRYLLLNFLKNLAGNPEQEYRFRAMLDGQLLPAFNAQRLQQAAQSISKLAFNPSQAEAFTRAFAAENYYLIQGPPGTGKTWVLAQLAHQLAQDGERVLITAFTHRAINNALRAIGQKTGNRQLVKVGPYHQADDLAWDEWQVPNVERLEQSPYHPSATGFIVGATPYALCTSRLNNVKFDTVIYDEAGQMNLPLALVGMQSANRAIFIGDHQQMPPLITAEHQREWVKQSIFEQLFRHTSGTMLDITYRMNTAINTFPSRQFYAGRLTAHPSASDRRLSLPEQPKRYATLLAPDPAAIFITLDHRGNGMRAPQEAELAANLAAEAFRCGLPANEIAIVAPYRAQGRLIRQQLQTIAAQQNLPGLLTIVVDTVERIQGQERDLVILSLTTSDPQHAAERAAFYFQPNRLNVAITRARRKRIVIGSPHLFETQISDPILQSWVGIFKALYVESTIIPWNAYEANLDPGIRAEQ